MDRAHFKSTPWTLRGARKPQDTPQSVRSPTLPDTSSLQTLILRLSWWPGCLFPQKKRTLRRDLPCPPAVHRPTGPTALYILQLGHLCSRAGPAAHLGTESVPSCLIRSFFQQLSPLPPTPLIFLSTRSCPAACKRAIISATFKKLSFDPMIPSPYLPFLSLPSEPQSSKEGSVRKVSNAPALLFS